MWIYRETLICYLPRANHLKYRLTPALALTLFGKEGTRKAQEIV
jgi:hypothetical protein